MKKVFLITVLAISVTGTLLANIGNVIYKGSIATEVIGTHEHQFLECVACGKDPCQGYYYSEDPILGGMEWHPCPPPPNPKPQEPKGK